MTVETAEGGRVLVNTTEAYARDGVWNAVYISGLNVTFTAQADEGWQFAGWEGLDSESGSVTLLLTEEGISLKAVFVRQGGEG